MKGNLQSWSWRDIQYVYEALGRQLNEYKRIKASISTEWLNRGFNSLALDSWWFQSAFDRDVRRIDEQLQCLDVEIARRNKLIGVMG